MVIKTVYFLSSSLKYFKVCIQQTSSARQEEGFAQWNCHFTSHLSTKGKMIEYSCYELGLSVVTGPLIFCIYFFYFKEIPDAPPNPNAFPEQAGWRKYISIKRDYCIQSNWKILNQLWNSMMNIFLQFVIMLWIFCLHLMFLQHAEIKMIEIMANCERSYLVCNVTKNAKKHIQKCNQKMKRITFLLQRKVRVIKKKQV